MARVVQTIDSQERAGAQSAERDVAWWYAQIIGLNDYLDNQLATAQWLASGSWVDEMSRAYWRGYAERMAKIIGESDGVVELFS